jgi:ABC-2 type transport system permease protein
MYAVFVKVLKVNYGVPHSGVYLLLGVVIWSFFSEITGGGVSSVVGKGDLLRKLNFPKYSMVLSGALSALINLFINLIVVGVFMIADKVDLSIWLLLSPLLLIELFVFCLALAFLLGTLYVRLRDIGHVWDVMLQGLFYATPIFFPLSFAPIWAQKIITLNPLAQIVQDLRYVLISPKTPTIGTVYGNQVMRLVPIAIAICALIFSLLLFKKRSGYFAEEI